MRTYVWTRNVPWKLQKLKKEFGKKTNNQNQNRTTGEIPKQITTKILKKYARCKKQKINTKNIPAAPELVRRQNRNKTSLEKTT